MNSFLKQISLWIVFLIIMVLVLSNFSKVKGPKKELLEPDFVQQLAQGNIKSVTIREIGNNLKQVYAELKNEVEGQKKIQFNTDTFKEEWKNQLDEQGVVYKYETENPLWQGLLVNVLPLLIIMGLFWFLMFRQVQGGSNKALSFGKSRARLVNQSDKVVTFNDVAGVDEAKEELQEIVEYLKDPKKFSRLGGRIPRGVLLVGPPGSGKTLLARAVAGEANVPFFSISGSDFVEMFVGVGASRVRDLFQQGYKNAPCIIFIDEIDAVGRQRGAGLGGGHDEREQTLNQLLVEMDGFNSNEGVILMAATNRPDVLDRALLRPGRFDRQIVVANPDVRGRKQILEVHIRNQKVPMDDDVDLDVLARSTPGFSGADLANMVNEAALLAARRNKDKVSMIDFEDAKDRVLMGPARKSLVLSAKEKLQTAYHEAGHVLVGRLSPDADPIHKATIIPRGPSLGVTSFLPEEDRHNLTKKWCLATIRVTMGGRAAEEIVFNEFTSGCANDLQQATRLAHSMVCEWGMSSLGPIAFGKNEEVFLGRDFVRMREFSEETAAAVDREVHTILEDAYRDTKALLEKHKDILDALAKALYDKETLESDEIDEIISSIGGEHILPERWKKDKQKKFTEEEIKQPQESTEEIVKTLPPNQPPLPDLA
ncbi:MAG TPA: ATP-dependent zinc metalloprotease FtsH [Candidatus Hydrogenedens sp.]|nr:ATP-dependent zinc metalloprotease FtsH [Candidatus Hydrogenedens sp.]HOL20315.1 ATP-dependent zinc metalloprotease FtsH [Candidatus Hydrogenedens sp.]HPP59844.1 ATP-dependent zinc metalloprotease FtsH [Candidatus Hydrogenedens sp.]